MNLPKVTANYIEERKGVAAVQMFAARKGQIFRETQTGDVGIDAQMEFVDSSGMATGHTVALQIKSGPTYFGHETERGWKYYPGEKHRAYWERYPIPVILVLHDSGRRRTYWEDARQSLRTPSRGENAFIEVPKANVLEDASARTLFENAGVQEEIFIEDLAGVFNALLDRRIEKPVFRLSFLDLFCGGLTNLCRSIHFGTDIAMSVASANIAMSHSEAVIGMGLEEHDFLFNFVRFLVAQNLANVDFGDCLIDIVDRQLTPVFVAPLTSRGRTLVNFVRSTESELVAVGKLPSGAGLSVAQEAFVVLEARSYFRRLPRLRQFQVALRPSLGSGYEP